MFLKPAMVTIAACIRLTRARAPEMQAENINRLSCILWTVIGPSIAVESSSHWAIIVFNFFFNLLRSCGIFFFRFLELWLWSLSMSKSLLHSWKNAVKKFKTAAEKLIVSNAVFPFILSYYTQVFISIIILSTNMLQPLNIILYKKRKCIFNKCTKFR